MSSMQLTTALNHAIAFLLNPLVAAHVEHRIIDALHIRLMVHLAAHYQATWDVSRPDKGSLQRVLFISARCPPRVIKAACEDVGLLWNSWGPALIKNYADMGADEQMELRVDPGKVEVFGPHGSKVLFEAAKTRARGVPTPSKNDFSIYEGAFRPFSPPPPSPITPWLLDQFPPPPEKQVARTPSPIARIVPRINTHSRTSSRSSTKSVDSMLSMTTGSTAPSTYSDDGTESDVDIEVVLRTLAIQDHEGPLPSPALTVPPSPSDSDHGLDAFYIDTNRKEVTIYESGKVGVLGGAVMLGVPAGGFKPKPRGGRRARTARA
ncbi:hypothetical protein BN14_00127 [Rhizoctonia solani AG-1 IB]|jgi:hypothetical protein|uniref:Anti-proliferative protein domain-containing protein n=1 Tax=Thanatephorus cucumeris (strain AG1-IB / isolate 7/3/14) TaxID=1108050 RepID=M5BJH2_THACB|nr:hypothetical protein BN14_00127 [Rhizoctonia solani AG-1 IB]